MLDEIPDDKQKNETYKEKLKDLFNLATVPFYWDATEPEEGKTRYAKDSEKIYRRPPADLCVEFCKENGIEPREHALCYDHFFPQWLKGKPDEVVKEHLEKRMQEVSTRYAEKIPIQITEVTIPAYTQEEEDEISQADVIEKLYSLWFSYPNVEQIVYWNLPDGYAAFTTPGNMAEGENYYRGGLLRFDMSEKPAYKRLKRLIKEVWTTDEELTANENGEVSFLGFYGEYEVTAGGKTYTVNFDKDGKEVTL